MVINVNRVLECREGKFWFEGRLGETLFKGRIVGCAPKVSQYPTPVRNGKTYEYISMDNIQLV